MSELARNLFRTMGGALIHRAECSLMHADATTVGAVPWLWAEGRPLEQVREAIAMVGSRVCAQCQPFESPKMDSQ